MAADLLAETEETVIHRKGSKFLGGDWRHFGRLGIEDSSINFCYMLGPCYVYEQSNLMAWPDL
jgi:hypothetical protein